MASGRVTPEYGQVDVMPELSAVATVRMLHLCMPDLRQQAGTWLARTSNGANNTGAPLNTNRSKSAQSRRIINSDTNIRKPQCGFRFCCLCSC